MDGIHHIHKRKRVHEKLKPYPHENTWINFLDRLLIVVAVIGPLMALPQIMQIYIFKNAAGVSALSWGLYTFFNIPWIIYGVVHRYKPITLGYILWFIVNLAVTIGALIY